MWACERMTASRSAGLWKNVSFLRLASARCPWNKPQSSSTFSLPHSMRCWLPVTSPAAPQNVIFKVFSTVKYFRVNHQGKDGGNHENHEIRENNGQKNLG